LAATQHKPNLRRYVSYQEYMKLMGMKGWLHWGAWYFKFSIFMLISVALMTLFFHAKVKDDSAVITYTDPTITFLFLLLFALSVMTFCFAISTFFSKGMKHMHLFICIYLLSNSHTQYAIIVMIIRGGSMNLCKGAVSSLPLPCPSVFLFSPAPST